MTEESVKCLCASCNQRCSTSQKDEYALRKTLTYIYLIGGDKIINTCNKYSSFVLQQMVTKIAMNVAEAKKPAPPPPLNFNANLSLAGFKGMNSKI